MTETQTPAVEPLPGDDRSALDDRLARLRDRRPDPAGRQRSWKPTTQRWTRWLHVYASMIALVVILFFGVSGLLLNHPSWTFGDELETTTHTGTLPVSTTMADGTIDFLSVSEYVRGEFGVSGGVDFFGASAGDASIAYRDPGYAADLFFDVGDGSFELTIEQEGWVAVLHDLHTGNDTDSGWNWVIDAAAVFLIVVAITGLTLQFFLRKRRTSALALAGLGGAALVVMIAINLG